MSDQNTRTVAYGARELPILAISAGNPAVPVRPTLTIAMDVTSGAIVGWHLAFDGAAAAKG